MITATRKSQVAQSRMERSRQQVKKPHVPALERVLPYGEKQRLMVLETLREECGRELANDARFNGEEFNWMQFNTEFRRDYAEVSFKELMGYARSKYGLRSIEEVRERRAAHKKIRAQRIAGGAGGLMGYEAIEGEMEGFDLAEFEGEESID